ncbi:MAG: dTMP kinase [Candidatus Roizmanbacteria bacterium]|nr:dTMP kinase [Candidatus Roizmanbacteria bacterium]
MFIVIEGIDGAGCETQATALIESLTKAGKKPFYIKFPHYDTPVGKMIRDFLYENKVKHSADEQFLLYTLQFIFDKELIKEKMKDHVVIADRYFSTTLCYQTLEGFDEEKAVRYAQDFNIVKPDAVLYLDVSPDTAIKWKYGEDKEKNFRENDHSFIRRTYEKYKDLVKRSVWARWIHVNGEQSKEKVTQELLTIINSL